MVYELVDLLLKIFLKNLVCSFCTILLIARGHQNRSWNIIERIIVFCTQV